MKHKIPFTLSVFMIIGIIAVAFAKPNLTITITNNTNFKIGDVILNIDPATPLIVNVDGNAVSTSDLTSNLISIKLNNTTVPVNTTASATTTKGDIVKCTISATTVVFEY